jgi:UDPglucose--hexose-1-phosphate uridylyltransferase
MTEYRQDRMSGAWVIVAPERGRRPRDQSEPPTQMEPPPCYSESCPFCPGNEHLLPGIISEYAGNTPSGWTVRVIPNKYAVVRGDASGAADIEAGAALPGTGAHEVVVETPRHNLDFGDLETANLHALLKTYRDRFIALSAQPWAKAVIVFRNRGAVAGASLSHPHSQVIATAIMPPRFATVTAWARNHHAGFGRCPTCEFLSAELEDGRRLIEVTKSFVALVPFAASGPFETRIVPRRHQSSFALIEDTALREMGALLQRSVRRIDDLIGTRPYNFAIESSLVGAVDGVFAHWSLRLMPHLTRPAGFELASGMSINPSVPEEDAAALRALSGRALPDTSNSADSAREDHDDASLER